MDSEKNLDFEKKVKKSVDDLTSKDKSKDSKLSDSQLNDVQQLFSQLESLESICEEWPEQYKNVLSTRVNTIDEINKEAFTRLIRALKVHPEVRHILSQAVSDPFVYTVLRYHEILKPSLNERVEEALENIRPMLASHGGGVELVTVEKPVVKVRFTGACNGCPASMTTFYEGVQTAVLDNIPEITKVEQVKSEISNHTASQLDSDIESPFSVKKKWTKVLPYNQLEDWQTKFIEVDNRSLILSAFPDQFTCFENSCAHMGMEMNTGQIDGEFLTCPHHGFKYSLKTGECLTAPEIQLPLIKTKVIEDHISVQLP